MELQIFLKIVKNRLEEEKWQELKKDLQRDWQQSM